MTAEHSPKLGLALSGGGVRAAVFHLGVLARLAVDDLLEEVTFISTVSGGSMVTGLVYAVSGNRWPSSEEFLASVLPKARRRVVTTSIQRDAIARTVRNPTLLVQGRAKAVSRALQHRWGVTGLVKDLPHAPRWVINATTYETGKNWRFTPERMGDYLTGYVSEPTLPLADAVAASAAYPGLIGPLPLAPRDYSWTRFHDGRYQPTTPPPYQRLHLWDGGVYDNLGLEALFKPRGNRFRDEFNFLVVSDASAPLKPVRSSFQQRPFRLVSIAMDQVRGLRARSVIDHLQQEPDRGVYLRLGNTAAYLFHEAGVAAQFGAAISSCLEDADVQKVATMKTTLSQVAEQMFDQLCRHGWEVADCTLASRAPNLFRPIPWLPL